MRHHVEKQFGFLKSTAIGGIVFLLPLAVVGFLLSKVGTVVYTVAGMLNEYLGINSAYGYFVLLSASVAIIIMLCFAAGVAAQLAIGKRLSSTIERHVTMIFPRYSIYKDQLAGGIGGDLARDRMKPVLIEIDGITRLALEIERTDDDAGDGTVTVYFPGAPDPWSGTIGFVDVRAIKNVSVDVGEFMATFERLGRGSFDLVFKTPASG